MKIHLRAVRTGAGAVLALCLLAPLAWAQSTVTGDVPLPAALSDFDAHVEGVREAFGVPGIAVAVVKDGQVVLARGYGVREAGREAPVGPETLFAIASISKGFTATALSILADEGKLTLDDRVIDHLPWFRMADPYVTREMRLRDLLAHRSGLGLGAGDLLYWPGTDYTTREVAQRLRDVPLSGVRSASRYAYDNILYGVAQLVVEEVAGMPLRGVPPHAHLPSAGHGRRSASTATRCDVATTWRRATRGPTSSTWCRLRA